MVIFNLRRGPRRKIIFILFLFVRPWEILNVTE